MTVSRARMSQHSPEFSRLITGFWRVNSWNMTPQQLLTFIKQNIELGLTSMDHAMVYNSEQPFGKALALQPALRDKIEIITKCGIRPTGFGKLGAQQINHYDSACAYIIDSVDNSLEALKTTHIDLLLIHRPDFLMDADEVARAFEILKGQGKVHSFGVSNFSYSQFELLQKSCSNTLVTNQLEFSPLALEPLENGIFDQCQQHKISPMLWSCLAGGSLLTDSTEKIKRIQHALRIVTEEVSASSLEEVVYAWAMTLPCKAFPLLGTSKIERIKIATQAEKIKLTREQWYRIWEAANGAAVP